MSEKALAKTMPQFTELPPGLRVLPGGKSVVRRQNQADAFIEIDFPRRHWADSEYQLRYHVYSSPTERVSVEASSVIEAIIAAGIENPFKIERGAAVDELRAAVVGEGRLLADEEAAAAPSEPEADETGEPDAETGECAGNADNANSEEPAGDDAEAGEPEPMEDNPAEDESN